MFKKGPSLERFILVTAINDFENKTWPMHKGLIRCVQTGIKCAGVCKENILHNISNVVMSLIFSFCGPNTLLFEHPLKSSVECYKTLERVNLSCDCKKKKFQSIGS